MGTFLGLLLLVERLFLVMFFRHHFGLPLFQFLQVGLCMLGLVTKFFVLLFGMAFIAQVLETDIIKSIMMKS